MPRTTVKTKFTGEVLDALRKAKIIGVRSGTEHKFTGVWPVIVGDRLFARSWNDKPTGWFQAFKKEPFGTLQVGNFEIPVEAKVVRGARVRDSITRAYAEKFTTKASQKWVDGFAEPEREANTIELTPRQPDRSKKVL